MHSVVARVWNEIAAEQPLVTQFARDLFHLAPDDLLQALEEREQALVSSGLREGVVAAFLAMAPLLWERLAIADYCAAHDYAGSLPNVENVDEALALASLDYTLSSVELDTIRALLEVGDYTLPARGLAGQPNQATSNQPRKDRVRPPPRATAASEPAPTLVAEGLDQALTPNMPRASAMGTAFAAFGELLKAATIIFGLIMFVSTLVNRCSGKDPQPVAGEPCGPGHHWTYVGDPIDPDLSCEPDR